MRGVVAALLIVVFSTIAYGQATRWWRLRTQYLPLERQRAEQRQQLERPATSAAPAASVRPSAPAAPDYWTDFRGPKRDGEYRERPIATDWSAGLQPKWKQPIGLGYASFAVGGGRAYTIEQRRNKEVVAAYDVQTGRELWTNSWTAEFRESMGGDGPRATPTFHENRVYALGAEGELRCLDAATGSQIWRTNILQDAGADNIQWGMSAAPLIVDNTVVTQPGGKNGASIVAYDKLTGKRLWQSLNDGASYTSPMLVMLAGRRQILTVTAARAVGLVPEDGSLIWEFPWENHARINVAQPVLIDPNRVFLSASYDKGAALIEISAQSNVLSARELWANNQMKNRFQTSVLSGGYLYGLDEGILACLDANTGERKWKGGRYGYGQVLLASGHLIVMTEEGQLALVRATPDAFTEVARVDALTGRSWNVPAFADGLLLVRNASEMAAYDLTVKSER